VDLDGEVAATGGILFHFNRPYGDIYMDVAESSRRRGLGFFLVQELNILKRLGLPFRKIRMRAAEAFFQLLAPLLRFSV
jgi:hypothetical protein